MRVPFNLEIPLWKAGCGVCKIKENPAACVEQEIGKDSAYTSWHTHCGNQEQESVTDINMGIKELQGGKCNNWFCRKKRKLRIHVCQHLQFRVYESYISEKHMCL